MKKLMTMAALACTVAFAASAQDALKERQEIMKNNGAQMKALSGFAKGETAYDAAAVLAALTSMRDGNTKLPDLFPEGSDTGDTEAAPAIWTDRENFDAALAKFISDNNTAVDAAPQDAAALGAQLATLGGDCKACHEKFRIEKD